MVETSQVSFPRAEVNEVVRVWLKGNSIIGQPLTNLKDRTTLSLRALRHAEMKRWVVKLAHCRHSGLEIEQPANADYQQRQRWKLWSDPGRRLKTT